MQKLHAALPPLLVAALAASISLVAQTPQAKPIKGVVVDKNGQPISGVIVYGGTSTDCCPHQQDKAVTNEKGEFSLRHSREVLQFWRSDLPPAVYLVKPDDSQIRVVMGPDPNPFVLNNCAPPDSSLAPIGMEGGLRYYAPKKAVKVQIQTDADYVRFSVSRADSKQFADFWFGPMAMPSVPDEKAILNSIEFSLRSFVRDHTTVGLDSRGHSSKGQYWRASAVLGTGATYWDVDKESAAFFDTIIDSACWMPYEEH